MATIVIAEAGVNHNGILDLAIELIDIAVAAGADYVKFQTFNADSLVVPSASKAPYQLAAGAEEESQLAMLRRLELNESEHRVLIEYCKNSGVGFLSTGFDAPSISMLWNLGQRIFKIPSGEITNRPLIEQVARFNCPIILSTGMSTLEEVSDALDVIEQQGTNRNQVTVLHCTSNYPATLKSINLRAMDTMRREFGVNVGYSDHSLGISVSLAAVAMGATIIEKHFTADKSLSGPDHKASLDPDELKELVREIRELEVVLGDGIKVPSASEFENITVIRKSLVAQKEILKGELFTIDNLTAKRPGLGISPMKISRVLGATATRDYAIDEIIEMP
jgi:N,N'-diacetyllegionaminate synthase